MNESGWSVERYPGFAFRGPSGGQALADLTIMRKAGETPVVVAAERDDNPGASLTNAAEQLAAAVLEQHFPGYVDSLAPPFTLLEHYPKAGEFQEVTFADYRVRHDRAVPRIGDVTEWKTVELEPVSQISLRAARGELERGPGSAEAHLRLVLDQGLSQSSLAVKRHYEVEEPAYDVAMERVDTLERNGIERIPILREQTVADALEAAVANVAEQARAQAPRRGLHR